MSGGGISVIIRFIGALRSLAYLAAMEFGVFHHVAVMDMSDELAGV